MTNYFTSIQKIDRILHNIKVSCENDTVTTFESIYQVLGSKYPEQFDRTELIRIIRKLEKDGYIEVKKNEMIPFIYITFEGSYFDDIGGYNQKVTKDKRIQSLTVTTHRLTWILAAGSAIAALCYLTELCVKYHVYIFDIYLKYIKFC